MQVPGEEFDPPTVTHRVSPRARSSMDSGATPQSPQNAQSQPFPEVGDDPTIALRQSGPQGPQGPQGGQNYNQGADDTVVALQRRGSSDLDAREGRQTSLQSAALVVTNLDPVSERVLVRAAAPILLMISHLRNSVERADVSSLRRQVNEEMDKFQQVAQRARVDAGDILAARYVLCATMDETVLMTPWGSRSEWSANSLLNQYHNETWGGEKVFQILDWVKQTAEKKLSLLILIHTCLMLGFEGRYRVLERGRDQLEDLRNDLSRTIRRYSTIKYDDPLSSITKGEEGGKKVNTFVPLWMVGVGAVCLLIIVYIYVGVMLSISVYPAVEKIKAIIGG